MVKQAAELALDDRRPAVAGDCAGATMATALTMALEWHWRQHTDDECELAGPRSHRCGPLRRTSQACLLPWS
ncbi:hypothetical protein [Streptomyces sp. NY05-11A]|uniref:hypothetical protein n=1 Tax=Streptomyces soliscabiei TaxID=588897 RepID=UPI0039F719C8